ncbi:MAG: restriction endonuclease subunit S [Rhizobacter sp.]
MKPEWPLVKIEDVCCLIVDCVNKTAPVSAQPTPFRMIRTTNVRDGRIDLTDCKFVDEETYRKWTRRADLRTGDVILTREAPIGQVGCVPDQEGLFLGQRLMQYRADPEKLDHRYLLYSFLSPQLQHQFGSHEGSGSVVSHIRVGDCFKFELRLAPLLVQRRIGDVLEALDAKIDLNRRINQTLEAMAQALFKSWFVDFDPVKAKIAAKAESRDPQRAAMSAISGKVDAELDALTPEAFDQLAATAALFPDEMEESALGEIPRGWSASSFGSLLSHTIGGDWGSDTVDSDNDTRVAIIRGTDIPDLDQAQAHRVPIRYTTQKKLASRMLQIGDIVLEVSGGSKDQPTGRSFRITANTIREFDCPIEPASFCRLLRPVNPEIGVILGLHLAHIYAQGKTWEYQNQSTGIANFQTTHFLEAELVANPPEIVAKRFYGLVNSLLEHRHDAQSRRLATLRDTLLPKLLSGELSVTEAMAEVDT